MLDPPAQIPLFRMLAEYPLVHIQDFPVGAVADGMNAKLIGVLDGQFRRLPDLFRVLDVESGAFGFVRVRLQQPGPARSERSIHIALDGADREVVVTRAFGAVVF